MASAVCGALQDQVKPMRWTVMKTQSSLHLVGLVADHAADLAGLKCLGCINDMKQHGQATDGL